MMGHKWVLVTAVMVCGAVAWGQPINLDPHIGYLYPAGGQQGTSFEVTGGGQHLRGVEDVHVSGEGVHASVVRYVGRFRLDNEQVRELGRRLNALWRKRLRDPEGEAEDVESLVEGYAPKETDQMDPVELPDHPLIANLEEKSLRELAFLRKELREFKRRQSNAQIGETVLIEFHVDPDALPGFREIRLGTPMGLTNPMSLYVGTVPEVREIEINDPDLPIEFPEEPAVDLPVVLNGQILPGDVDRFRLRARQGQRLVVVTQARRLIPYLADAVPGWFQATVALYDSAGNEVAFADDFRFHPDPVFCYEIPADGEYELEVRDAIYRGREDFVYRIAVGETPFITRTFPLGGREGDKTTVDLAGWNLPVRRMRLDTTPGVEEIRQTALYEDGYASNEIEYAVDALPESEEKKANDTVRGAQHVKLPRIVNGIIERPGDVDVFEFKGHEGDEIVAETIARRLSSPVDSLVRLMDADGNVLAWNDDAMTKDGHLHTGEGLLTHHADSYLRFRLPKDGTYRVSVADAQRHGGQEYAYRLRLAHAQPDFAVRVTPASLNVPPGRSVPVCVHVLRKDGFDGPVTLGLRDAPEGFFLDGSIVPAGMASIRMTLSAPPEPLEQPLALNIEGHATVNGETVIRKAEPAEDMMQAFLYRHLAPAEELMVASVGKRPRPPVRLAEVGLVSVPEGGSTKVRVRIPRLPKAMRLQLALSDPPQGMAIGDITSHPRSFTFPIEADGAAAKAGLRDNLIVEAFGELPPPKNAKEGSQKAKKPRRVSLGVLPAIPFEVVAQQ